MSHNMRSISIRERFVRVAGWGLLLGLGGILVSSSSAFSQITCDETLPAPLIAFCPGSPARASEMNSNFRTVHGWIQNKLGSVDSPNLTIGGNVSIAGTVSVPSGSLTGDALRDGSVNSADLQDGTIAVADLNPAAVGAGLQVSGSTLRVDPTWLRAQIRAQVRLDPTEYRVDYHPAEDGRDTFTSAGRTRPTDVPMTAGACFLIETQFPDDSREQDLGHCRINSSTTGFWQVQGWSNADDIGDWNVICTARCIRWD